MRSESADSSGVQVSRIVGLNRGEQRPGSTPRGGHPIPSATPLAEQPTTRQHLGCAGAGPTPLLEGEGEGAGPAPGPAPSSARWAGRSSSFREATSGSGGGCWECIGRRRLGGGRAALQPARGRRCWGVSWGPGSARRRATRQGLCLRRLPSTSRPRARTPSMMVRDPECGGGGGPPRPRPPSFPGLAGSCEVRPRTWTSSSGSGLEPGPSGAVWGRRAGRLG